MEVRVNDAVPRRQGVDERAATGVDGGSVNASMEISDDATTATNNSMDFVYWVMISDSERVAY